MYLYGMKFWFIYLILIFSYPLLAENSIQKDSLKVFWKQNFATGIDLNQASFSDNWKGGGSNTFATGWY